MKKKMILAGIGVLIGLAGLSVAVIMVLARNTSLHGSLMNPAMPAPPLSLATTDSQTFDLTQERGQIVLVFFGYTSCTDICPATMAQLHQVLAQLGKQAANVKVVFVTVDPQRDTVDQMHQYLMTFDPAFVGLTGSMDQLTQIWKVYGVYRQIQPNAANPSDYSIDHSSDIYLIDQKGDLRLTYSQGTDPQDIIQDIQTLLAQS
jgi:protein SCO1